MKSNGTKIYNFIDRTVFSPRSSTRSDDRQNFDFQADDVIFLSLSRVAQSNGALELVKRVIECDQRIPRAAKFVVAGFTENPIGYARETQELMKDNPRFNAMDYVTDVTALLNASDVVVAPFTTPHSARSVFEGAAMGIPALVSDLPNLTELIDIGKTGLVFDWADQSTFVSTVNQLCEPGLRRTMGDAATDFARTYFDATRNVEKTMEVYRNLLTK